MSKAGNSKQRIVRYTHMLPKDESKRKKSGSTAAIYASHTFYEFVLQILQLQHFLSSIDASHWFVTINYFRDV